MTRASSRSKSVQSDLNIRQLRESLLIAYSDRLLELTVSSMSKSIVGALRENFSISSIIRAGGVDLNCQEVSRFDLDINQQIEVIVNGQN